MSVQLRSMVAACPDSVTSTRLADMTGQLGQNNAYGSDVREGEELDRAAWATLLGGLLMSADLTPEQAAQPVGPVPAGWRTIRRWLKQETGVSALAVRDVSRALGYPPTRALVEVGFLQHQEVGITGLAAPPSASADRDIRKYQATLADKRIPTGTRSILRRLLNSAYDSWLEMYEARAHTDVVDRPKSRPRR